MLALVLQAPAASPWHWIALAVWALGELLAVAFVWRIIASGGAPASTLLWVVVILLLPSGIGIALYYLFPRRLQQRRLRRLQTSQQRFRQQSRPRADAGAVSPASSAQPSPEPSAQRSAQPSEETSPEGSQAASLEDRDEAPHEIRHDTRPEALAGRQEPPLCRLLLGIAPEGMSAGNLVRWLPSGNDFFAAASLAIESAQRSVCFQVYIFRPDATGLHLLRLLSRAARRGVAVRLLYDSFGSFGLKAAHLQELRAAGGLAEAFLPLLWKRRPFTVNLRNHRKLLVVDERVAFTGGRNVGDEYSQDRFGARRKWLDAMVQVEGPAALAMHECFAQDWFFATDEELPPAQAAEPAAPRGHDVLGIVGSGPDRDSQPLWLAAFQAVADSRERIDLSSPYLVPPPPLLLALRVAAARGVAVRIYTNGPRSEARVLYHAQRSYYDELIAAGVELYETEADYNHAKILVVDGRVVMVGSANMDMRSAHLNFELACVLPDSPDFARQALATLQQRESGCRRVQSPAQSGPVQRFVDGICRLFSPLL